MAPSRHIRNFPMFMPPAALNTGHSHGSHGPPFGVGKLRSLSAAAILRADMPANTATIEDLCDQRDRLKKEEGGPMKGRVLSGRNW